MNLNPLGASIYEVIEDKGFHDIRHSQVESVTFRQLLHLVTEWAEMMALKHAMTYKTGDEPAGALLGRFYEEGADILIVALDLAAMHRLDMGRVPLERPYYGPLDHLFSLVPQLIGMIGDGYRKGRSIDRDKLVELVHVVSELLRRHGGDALKEVERKMARNRERPRRYGTAEVTE
jgi:hypothetical protein